MIIRLTEEELTNVVEELKIRCVYTITDTLRELHLNMDRTYIQKDMLLNLTDNKFFTHILGNEDGFELVYNKVILDEE